MSARGLAVFLGPSLPLAEARRLAPGARFLPPARQGDVWRALAARPRAIALVDGVFESAPSVWHRELLDALDAGVRLLGASSMGALRAAELHALGMEGVGAIFAAYRDGRLIDDAEVALLHSDAAHDYRPLTAPLVDVRHAAARAQARRVLSPAEARALVAEAARTFYQERRWPSLVRAAARRWRPGSLARWERFARDGLPSLKAEDARLCLRRAAQALREPPPAAGASARPRSSMARQRRALEGSPGAPEVLRRLSARADAAALAEAGLRRLLVAAALRARGIVPTAAEVAEAGRGWLASLGVRAQDRAAFLAESGLAADEARALAATLALDRLAREHAPRLVPDGPSALEGLALEARLLGRWAAVARALRRNEA